ncbi:Sugar lactone lactonase YvrE (YvrE) (PDB:1E1A) [Commensalibacter communis]|uniref:L-dopachrome tautomerase-related protein n=1 Tax=Commensalibacter communis TaxID=2972786 RepID=UPI0022FFA93E|nr:L-dopachrome tautomerase-related protein [Commensalibacter communis]CAI3941385.1 Sugar lactone lactonase YvrE (YvrE) (PDB:1E1A) [Commensalibacter communis]CAI3942674.1 Sugar lactone lactonase YvrE (YvrE) (PDB:1E1A) [Commensalibacter communis]
MKKTLLTATLFMLLQSSPFCYAAPLGDTGDPSAIPAGSIEVLDQFTDPGPSGIAVTPDKRVFVSFPRHAQNHKDATLAEIIDGQRLPFPNNQMSLPSNLSLKDRLISVHGIALDSRNNLWVIDDGKRAGIKGIPDGAAKVVGFDIHTHKVIASIPIHAPTLLQDSHLNDLRVDLTHGEKGTAYITDSSFGTSPALVIVDLATGKQRRVLANHVSTQPEKGFVAYLAGKPRMYDPQHPSFPVGGADGVTLSHDSKTLYYAPLTSRRLYSIPTAILSDFQASEGTIEKNVKDLGEKGFADGLANDPQDRIYTTNGEHNSIWRRWPDGHMDLIARDPRIDWPDGIAVQGDIVYVVAGQWERLGGFHQGKDLREPNYLLLAIPLKTPPVIKPSQDTH